MFNSTAGDILIWIKTTKTSLKYDKGSEIYLQKADKSDFFKVIFNG